MKDNEKPEEKYFKHVGKGFIILEWACVSVVVILFLLFVWTVLEMAIGVAVDSDFSMREYLVRDSAFVDPHPSFLIVGVLFLLEGWERYRLTRKDFFASISDEDIILSFGDDSILWDDIQEVDVEGERKLIIALSDEEKSKRKVFDLQWLSEKRDFIHSLEENCIVRSIPCRKCELSFFSQMTFFLHFLIRYPSV